MGLYKFLRPIKNSILTNILKNNINYILKILLNEIGFSTEKEKYRWSQNLKASLSMWEFH